jgi:hypothetical protein
MDLVLLHRDSFYTFFGVWLLHLSSTLLVVWNPGPEQSQAMERVRQRTADGLSPQIEGQTKERPSSGFGAEKNQVWPYSYLRGTYGTGKCG